MQQQIFGLLRRVMYWPECPAAVLGTHLLIACLHISCGASPRNAWSASVWDGWQTGTLAETLFSTVGSGGRDVAQAIRDAGTARFRASLHFNKPLGRYQISALRPCLPFVPIVPHTIDRAGLLTTPWTARHSSSTKPFCEGCKQNATSSARPASPKSKAIRRL